MSPRADRLHTGAQVWADGAAHKVIGWSGESVIVRRLGNGQVWSLSAQELLRRPDYRHLQPSTEYEPHEVSDAGLLASYETEEVEQAWQLVDHLNEMRTGFRSGTFVRALAHEPRPEYDPALTNKRERVEAKSAELTAAGPKRYAVSTLRNAWTSWKKSGIVGLLDSRRLRGNPIEPLDAAVVLAADELMSELYFQSDIRFDNFITMLRVRVADKHDEADVTWPGSDHTLRQRLKALGRPRGFFLTAKQRRQHAVRPDTPYYHKHAERPGEFVLIDATTTNVWALDDDTGEPVRVDLLASIDLFSRCVPAARITPRNTNRVDAALLLRDMVMPKLMRPDWPAEARWNYVGVPETIILDLCSAYGLPREPAGIPVMQPETVVVDNAWAYGSYAFRDGCCKLGTTIYPARPARPADKAHIEAFFRLVDEKFFQLLPGYTGRDVLHKGHKAQGSAYHFVSQLQELFEYWLAVYYHRRPHRGCRLAPACYQELSPNEMYDLGIASSGMWVPPHPDLYYDLLPVIACKVHRYGVEPFPDMRYDGDALDPLRDVRSGLGGRLGDKYPISYDPRDCSRVYYRDTEGQWHELLWEGHREGDGPFRRNLIDRIRATVVAGTPNRRGRRDAMKLAMEDFYRRVRAHEETREERALLRQAAIEAPALARDRAACVPRQRAAVEGHGVQRLAGSVISDEWLVDDGEREEWE
jgi:transposase InsO family protein